MTLRQKGADRMADVRLNNVNKFYGAAQALHDISLTVADGEFAVFVGPSGCGKSTLLRSIAGLEPISGGTVSIGGRDVSNVAPSARDVAMVFQSYALYPHMTVRENMDFGMKVNKFPAADRTRRITEAARILQLGDYLDRKPAQLSGGQRQRVVLARTLVTAPRYLLLDEPVSALDAALVAGSINLLRRLQDERAHGCLIISHDLTAVGTLAHRVAVMYAGEIVETGPTRSVLTDARHPYTQALAAATLVADVDAGLPEIGTLDPPADTGCAYSTRCPSAIDRCHTASPPLLPMNDGTSVRCWLVGVDPTSNQSCPEGASEAG